MTALFNALMARPIFFVATVVAALALLPVAVWLDLRHLSDTALGDQARSLDLMISDIRNYYAKNIVSRVNAAGGKAVPVHNYEDVDGGIPIPATLSLELGEVIGGRGENMKYRFVSDFPFKSRKPHDLDEFEQSALKTFRAVGAEKPVIVRTAGSIFNRNVRLAAPVLMGESCVGCHNTHPESPKRDWAVGDVRGIQEVEIAQPIADNIFSFKYLLTYFAGAGLFGVAFASMQWRQARVFRRMNSDLEEANSFLAAVSMKISKYLSPQVYRSIFSGERDVVISTERKKLTVFFSDIKDFTVTSERLQPEELTQLLNEYFTEMSKIAQEHGATVDKFIGDAILAFFGDPETKGPKEDAQACVRMAVAMQRRMAELNDTWRQRGIEKPFRTRMGINTGYCNVGNFGSEDRMDYTIIGAEANLAARLESIAEPGGIVLSYETYALVSDIVRARPLEAISLKGISRQVVPYVVEAVPDERVEENGDVINEFTEGARIFLDMGQVSERERVRLAAVLKQAMERLQSAGQPGH